MSRPSTSASVSDNDKRKSKDWRYRTHKTDLLSPDENKFDHKKNSSMKEKVLRNTQFQNMHGIGEIKRAQEQRIDVVSLQKFRANHETIQQLTAQLQQMREQMNSMSDSVDFKMWNQIKVEECLTFPVESNWIAGKRFWKSVFYV